MAEVKFEVKDGQLYEYVAQPVGEEPTQEQVDAAQAAFDQASADVEEQDNVLKSIQASLEEAEGCMRQKVEVKADAESALTKSQARLLAAAAARELAEQQPEPEEPAEPSEDPGTGQASGDVATHPAEGVEQPAEV